MAPAPTCAEVGKEPQEGAPLGKLPVQVQSPIQELSYAAKPSAPSTAKTEVASGVPQLEA